MQKYLITSKDYYPDDIEIFCSKLHRQLVKHQPTYVLFRDKTTSMYDVRASFFVKVCSEFRNIKSFVHQRIDLAKKLNATGVHLTSTQFDEIQKAKDLGLEVIISTHNHSEVLKAQALGADAVTYSPIFFSPNKDEPKGIEDLKDILNKSNINIFALGGIVESKHINMIKKTKAYGFASIRYFY